MKITLAIVTVLFISGLSYAQDPVKAAPDSYKLQLENEWVKVLRVTYAAHGKVPIHDHSRFPAGYVYLSDSGPIRFVHENWDDPVLTRPATKARSFRLSPTTQSSERHRVENDGDLASEFLRIEFKKLRQGKDLPLRRVPPADVPAEKNLSQVEFENDYLRVTRFTAVKGKPLEIKADGSVPTLIVVLAAGKLGRKDAQPELLSAGDTIWLDAGRSRTFDHVGTEPFEILRFDLVGKK